MFELNVGQPFPVVPEFFFSGPFHVDVSPRLLQHLRHDVVHRLSQQSIRYVFRILEGLRRRAPVECFQRLDDLGFAFEKLFFHQGVQFFVRHSHFS